MSGSGSHRGSTDWTRFQTLLDEQNAWPAEYVFKFIVPVAKLPEARLLFGRVPVHERPSRNGNFVSVTATLVIHSSDEVVAMYEAASTIEGLIAL